MIDLTSKRPELGQKVIAFIQNFNDKGGYYHHHVIAYYCKYRRNKNQYIFVDSLRYENEYKVWKGNEMIIRNVDFVSAPDNYIYQFVTHWEPLSENPPKIKKRLAPKIYM